MGLIPLKSVLLTTQSPFPASLMLNIIFLLQYESSAEKCYYLDTRCSSVDLSRITFIFKAVTGWLVISRHKRCFCKTMDIRLKNKQNTEARKAVLNALTYKTEWQNVNSIKINGVAFVVSSNAAQGHVMVQMPLSNYATFKGTHTVSVNAYKSLTAQ